MEGRTVAVLARGRFLRAAGLVALAAALVETWIVTGLGGARTTLWVDDLSIAAAAAIACVSCVRAGLRGEGRLRGFWWLLAAATACWTVAECTWSTYELVLGETVPSPSWADVGYLLAIPFAVAALVVHPAIGHSATHRARSLLDGLTVASALLFLSWTLVFGTVWRHAELGTLGGVVTLAYPFGDVVMVFFVALAIRGMTGGGRRSLWCLLAALVVMAVTDSAFSYLSEAGGYYTSTTASPIDGGWFAAYLGIALAAFDSRAQGRRPATALPAKASLAACVSPLVPVFVALSVATVQIELGHRLDHVALAMALCLIALVLIRQGLLLLELRRLGHGGGPDVGSRQHRVTAGDFALEAPAKAKASR